MKEAQILPLPLGLAAASEFERLHNGKLAVKWVLLSPPSGRKFWKESPARHATPLSSSAAGARTGYATKPAESLLRTVDSVERRRRRKLNHNGKGYSSDENAAEIMARLVAAIVSKPVVVTGWSLPDTTIRDEGAKSTHLAVAPGSVYYFEVEPDANGGAGNAVSFANALNWHGLSAGTEIKNRRERSAGRKGLRAWGVRHLVSVLGAPPQIIPPTSIPPPIPSEIAAAQSCKTRA